MAIYLIAYVTGFAIAFEWLSTQAYYAFQARNVRKCVFLAIVLEAMGGLFINTIGNHGLYILPSAIGAGIGTYLAVARTKRGENLHGVQAPATGDGTV